MINLFKLHNYSGPEDPEDDDDIDCSGDDHELFGVED